MSRINVSYGIRYLRNNPLGWAVAPLVGGNGVRIRGVGIDHPDRPHPANMLVDCSSEELSQPHLTPKESAQIFNRHRPLIRRTLDMASRYRRGNNV